MHPYTGNYIEHIDSTTNNFKYYTFAPRPLMNGNMYQMDDELATLLTEAHRNIGFLEGLIQFAPNRDPFTELILLKECTYSRMIDYTGPNFKDVLTICGTGKGDISPIMNLKSAYKTAMTMEIAAPNLSRICGIALNGDEEADSIGVRDHQTFWLGAKTNLREYNPTEPDAVLPTLADISAYLYNGGEDPLIQAALVHYQFEMIHPFEKYNGVVGRILPFMVLRKIVGNALPVLCLSEHLLLNKNEYFDMLRTTQYSGGYVRWIKFFMQIINEAARNSAELLKKYEEAIKLDEERLRNAMPQTSTFWNVYEYIKAFPVTNIPIVAQNLSLSYNSVSKAFSTLQENNLIMQGSSAKRNRVWEYSNLDFIFSLPYINETTSIFEK